MIKPLTFLGISSFKKLSMSTSLKSLFTNTYILPFCLAISSKLKEAYPIEYPLRGKRKLITPNSS